MRLQQSIHNVFVQITASLELLSTAQYVHAGKTLSHTSIGKHVRHIIEMFTCLEEGYETGVIHYEQRKRDTQIETEKDFAIGLLKRISADLDRPNKPLLMETVFDGNDTAPVCLDTNYYREVAYNLEHTIHHMALIKVGIREVSDIEIPDGFGVASSTIKFRSACAH